MAGLPRNGYPFWRGILIRFPVESVTVLAWNIQKTRDLDVESEEELKVFINWVSRECMGGDIDVPEVHLGYLVDHYFFECDDIDFANNYLQKELGILIPKNRPVADAIWSEIA